MQNEELKGRDLLEIFNVKNERTGKIVKVLDEFNTQVSDAERKVKNTGSGAKVIITLSIDLMPKMPGWVKTTFDVSSKVPKYRNERPMYQDEKGGLYIDESHQLKILDVVDIEKGKKEKA